jgi:hypothetical protein
MTFPTGFAAGLVIGILAAFVILILAAHAIDKADHA